MSEHLPATVAAAGYRARRAGPARPCEESVLGPEVPQGDRQVQLSPRFDRWGMGCGSAAGEGRDQRLARRLHRARERIEQRHRKVLGVQAGGLHQPGQSLTVSAGQPLQVRRSRAAYPSPDAITSAATWSWTRAAMSASTSAAWVATVSPSLARRPVRAAVLGSVHMHAQAGGDLLLPWFGDRAALQHSARRLRSAACLPSVSCTPMPRCVLAWVTASSHRSASARARTPSAMYCSHTHARSFWRSRGVPVRLAVTRAVRRRREVGAERG